MYGTFNLSNIPREFCFPLVCRTVSGGKKNPKYWEKPTMYKAVQKQLLHKHSDPVVSLLLTHSIWVDSTGGKTGDN